MGDELTSARLSVEGIHHPDVAVGGGLSEDIGMVVAAEFQQVTLVVVVFAQIGELQQLVAVFADMSNKAVADTTSVSGL